MKKIVAFGEIMLPPAPTGHCRFSQAQTFEAICRSCEGKAVVCRAPYFLRLGPGEAGRAARPPLLPLYIVTLLVLLSITYVPGLPKMYGY